MRFGLSKRVGQFGLLAVVLLVLQFTVSTVPQAMASGSSDVSFAAGPFRRVWEVPDLPILAAKASRSYFWGPEGWAFGKEPYQESPDGQRLVQYFDKTRMEITNPNANPADRYFVTNGLLVTEMVSGQLQLGNNKFQATAPAEIPVAGDAVNNPSPTYNSFKAIASLNLDNKVQRASGALVTATIDRDGKLGNNPDLGKYNVKNLEFDTNLNHNIPDVFWNFMNQQGTIYQYSNNQYLNGLVFDWVSAMGYPLAEPYWAQVVVGGQTKDVMIQLFQRRVLTYTPSNPDAFKVEMGNVGAHYYAWRYPNQERKAPWTVTTITNEANCGAIALQFSGQDAFTAEIAPLTTKTLKLGPGQYHMKITADNSCNADPLELDKTADPNGKLNLPINVKPI